MHLVVRILLTVIAAMWIACLVEGDILQQTQTESNPHYGGQRWRRTVDGWEHIDLQDLQSHRKNAFTRFSNLHPFVPALLLALVSVGALLAFPHPSVGPRFVVRRSRNGRREDGP